MAYYRLRDRPSREALEARLERLRSVTVLHPEASTDDADDS